ncbi:MAG: PKD domain-containing protein [Acidobacteriota bacterium]|nr:PKD domain-containing protein [Thermoanaerobaculaceae bacterium]
MKKSLVVFAGTFLFLLLISCSLSNLFKKEEPKINCEANVNPTSGYAPLTVAFMANATVTGTKDFVTYTWDFGDGQFSTSQNASHTYRKSGTYMWNLTATVAGVSCTRSGSIQVEGRGYSQPSDDGERPPSTSSGEGNAGVGIKLVTNLRSGVFRVKINGELKAEHSFHNEAKGKNILKPKKLLKAKDYEWGKEFKVPAGDCKIKLVIEDNQGSRGEKVINLNMKANQHKFLRVVVRGAPGDMRVEM